MDIKTESVKAKVPDEGSLKGGEEGDEVTARRGEWGAGEGEQGDEVQSQDGAQASAARVDGSDGEGCGRVMEVYQGRVSSAKRPREEVASIGAWCALFPHIVSERHGIDERRGNHQALSGEETREGAAEDEVQAGTAVF